MLHPEWTGDTSLGGDLAILWLAETFRPNNGQFAALSVRNPSAGSVALGVGWGATERSESSAVLRGAALKVSGSTLWKLPAPEPTCYLYIFCFGGSAGETWRSGPDSVMTGPDLRETCKGDSGGPLFVAGAQVGVTSWGPNVCGRTWGAYSSVAYHQDWTVAARNWRPQPDAAPPSGGSTGGSSEVGSAEDGAEYDVYTDYEDYER
jgi:secreted trypsin-like serine protease